MTPLAIAVTGNIGSGKSAVCEIFKKLGAEVLYADEIAKHLENHDPVIKKKIIAQFGAAMYGADGMINKKALARVIFTDDAAVQKINNIVHPATIESIQNSIAAFKKQAQHPLLHVESALIYEAGIDEMFDYVVLVYADDELAIARVMKRDSAPRTGVIQRQQMQIPAEQKLEVADFVICNSGNMQELEKHCKFVHSLLTALANS